MALTVTLEGIRSRILDSIKGRKLGLDQNGFLTGHPGDVRPITSHTSAGSTAITNYGVSLIHTTSNGSSFTLAAPFPGVGKTLIADTTGGGVVTLAAGSNFVTSASSTQTILTFASSYANQVNLFGLSTAAYMVAGALTTGVTIA